MSWRPKDWEGYPFSTAKMEDDEGKYKQHLSSRALVRIQCESAFELGADAMLEALKKSGTYGHLFDSSILAPDGKIHGLKVYEDSGSQNGTFIFIPD